MCLRFIGSRANAWAIMATNDIENLARSCPSAVKDVIVEILETRMARSKHYYKTGLCSRPFVPAAFGPGTIGVFCPGSNG